MSQAVHFFFIFFIFICYIIDGYYLGCVLYLRILHNGVTRHKSYMYNSFSQITLRRSVQQAMATPTLAQTSRSHSVSWRKRSSQKSTLSFLRTPHTLSLLGPCHRHLITNHYHPYTPRARITSPQCHLTLRHLLGLSHPGLVTYLFTLLQSPYLKVSIKTICTVDCITFL